MTDKTTNRINELKKQAQDIQEAEEKGLVLVETQDLAKPERDTKFAHESAKILKDIVQQNHWIKSFGGQSSHLMYEGWQTLGKYYGYTVKTHGAEPVTFGDIQGFKAQATVINEVTGIEVGSAEAFCMRDEPNWKTKPVFQLASMAQTRAGSKALRQILGFVVALAGYNPTPAEEMDGVHDKPIAPRQMREQLDTPVKPQYSGLATEKQVKFIHDLLLQKHYYESSLLNKYEITDLSELTFDQASDAITNLTKLPVAQKKTIQTQPVKSKEEFNYDEIDKAISQPN